MKRRYLLDLFCCAGGAARGYYDAEWDVVGVDINPQPNYPYLFIQGDALDFYYRHARSFDAFHASPPCHDHTTLSALSGEDGTGSLLADTYALFRDQTRPWVIENVIGAKLPIAPAATLCGSSFGLGTVCADGQYRQLRRHRKFWSNVPLLQPECRHDGQPIGVYGTGGGGQMTRGYKGNREESLAVMQIDWMSRAEISQAIPPAFTEFIGAQLLEFIDKREVA